MTDQSLIHISLPLGRGRLLFHSRFFETSYFTSSSPLLQLPSELRNQIWSEVLDWPTACVFEWRYERASVGLPSRRNCSVCHGICPTNHSRTISFVSSIGCALPQRKKTLKRHDPTISLAFFRTCRQIYVEASALLYSSRVFSFEQELPFLSFINNLTALQYFNLRSLHLSLESRLWLIDPKHSLVECFVPALQSPGLRDLSVCVKNRSLTAADPALCRVILFILNHTTALENVTVILSRRGPLRYRPEIPPLEPKPHPLSISPKSLTKLVKLQTEQPLQGKEQGGPVSRWECIEWPAERQTDFANSVEDRLSNPWATLAPQNYVRDERPPKYVLFNSIERAFW